MMSFTALKSDAIEVSPAVTFVERKKFSTNAELVGIAKEFTNSRVWFLYPMSSDDARTDALLGTLGEHDTLVQLSSTPSYAGYAGNSPYSLIGKVNGISATLSFTEDNKTWRDEEPLRELLISDDAAAFFKIYC